ncbi:hypothetical protein L1049_016088 [Liquidambar formosana]|uniref:EF-hand domain-containing protein n=1 Tax=Liquidambar formosana TaxID=63359 RepID=A0AAP0X2X3_LIQFO
MLASLKERAREGDAESTGIQEIREAVLAYYKAAAEEHQQLAREFFESMDANGDGKVSLHEYLQFLRERGYTHFKSRNFFHELDRNHDGTLDFDEVLCLYYIIKTERPFCDGCAVFLKALFFTCAECYDKGSSCSFNLCSKCFGNRDFNHQHNTIVDNYLLLARKREKPTVVQSTTSRYTQAQPTPSTSTQLVVVPQATSRAVSTLSFHNFIYFLCM